jgi:hypothetical protein
MYSFFDTITASSFLTITRDSDVSSSCPARIKALFIVFSASTLNPVKIIDRFSAVFSISVKSLF